jgi:type II secretory ATPase GspE/PulE/Tfp pilus assembly ATPase PilB-like protein
MNNLLPYAFARDYGVLARSNGDPAQAVEVLVSNATKPAAIAEVSRRFGRIVLRRMDRAELEAAIAAAYAGAGGDASQVADEFDADLDLTKLLQDVPAIEDLLESSDDAPVIRMINALLTQSLREGASDIHIEPFEQTSVVRFRIDGALRDIVRPRKAIHASLISRIKIMSAARHRRKAPAAGRPHHAAHGRQAGRRARLDPADRPRRTRRAASARQGSRPPRPVAPGHEPGPAAAVRQADQPAARHRAGHRPDRFR